MARWASLDEGRSWRFYCSNCGNGVYWPQRKEGPLECPYPTCPWCGEKMEGAGMKYTTPAKIREQDVIRCKDCKHHLECDYWIENGDDWFCADGKRR